MKDKNEDALNKADAEIMEWHYQVCEINFGVEGYIQDSSDLRDILAENIKEIRTSAFKKAMAVLPDKEAQSKFAHATCYECFSPDEKVIINETIDQARANIQSLIDKKE